MSPPETSSGKYALSTDRVRAVPPRDGLERLARVLARPVWTRADRDRLERAHYGLLEHHCRDRECPRCAMSDRIGLAIKEWDRIDKAPPIPSPAQLRRPARMDRAIALRDKLKARRLAALERIHATVKPYKTYAVRVRHQHIAECADPELRRIDRAMERLRQIAP